MRANLLRFARAAALAAALLGSAPGMLRAAGLEGRVTDANDRPVARVRVVVSYADGVVEEQRSDAGGEFRLALPGRLPARVQAFAPGFALFESELTDAGARLAIALEPSRLADTVTVTASRTETPASRSIQSVIVLPREDLEATPALSLDDYLRKVPGFTLFRRSSSFVANPTSQGVSLRGVGPSGASRSLVLADGVPLNDPFGGYIYWGRVPRVAIDRVEVLRGGASELYGTDALGGVIQLFRRPPASRTVTFEGYEGTLGTRDYSLYASHRVGRFGGSFAGEFFHTDGYNQVNPAERGRVDVNARSERHAFEASGDVRLGANARAWVIGSEFSERRGNGTPLQTNDTQIRNLAAGASFAAARSQWTVQAFTLGETFDQFSSSVALDRATETLSRSQRVPATSAGIQALWRRALGRRHLLLAGVDYMRVKGASDEIGFTATGATSAASSTIRSDGRQDRGGTYVQDLIQLTSRLEVVLGLRWDRWVNHEAFSFTHTLATGVKRQTPFASRNDAAWSPKAGARVELRKDLALRGAVARSFRAPTLNELYRGFRVGNIQTRENPDLGPERATMSEIGVDWGLRSPVAVRATYFWADIDNPVASVTLSTTPALITRQRQNLGSTRSRGVELDTIWRPDRAWMIRAGYFYSDSTVRSAPAAQDLVGLRIPQLPRHQGVFETAYRRENGLFASVDLRLSSPQFDDDQNRLPLAGYGVVNFSVGKRIAPGVELFFGGENLFDHAYPIARSPVVLFGMPRRFEGGVRFRIE
jgi:outer membrane receptor protein involved in Fe transport